MTFLAASSQRPNPQRAKAAAKRYGPVLQRDWGIGGLGASGLGLGLRV